MSDPGASRVFEDVKARLNLLAVLPDLEDVVRDDAEMRALVRGARITVRFNVAGGPKAFVRLADGVCTVGKGGGAPGGDGSGAGGASATGAGATVNLWFTSPAHLNRMFDGKANPIPLWGFNHLGFLKNEFTRLTDRMAHYLTPTDELLADPEYLAMNTRLTLNTAAAAVPELLAGDPDCRHLAHAFPPGTVVLKVLPDGPAVSIVFEAAGVRAVKVELPKPSALVLLPGLRVANDFLNGKLDTFAAVARGDVQIWGRIGMVDALSLVLDRVPKYLEPAAAKAG